jgi:UDP-galactopyranose mutase
MTMSRYDVLVVGAGFAGSVCAERLASAGKRVLIIDRRSHVGGNAYDKVDSAGVLTHVYGPHLFHTNGKRIFEYLSRFTAWRFYEHRVRAAFEGKLYPIPINRRTINELYGLALDEAGVTAYLDNVRVPREPIKTSEDVVLNSVGNDLCEKFFRGYTKKQWGVDLSQLSAGVAARIPTRSNDDDRYFTDTYQFMPADGYTALFNKLLGHPKIEVELGVNYERLRGQLDVGVTVYTGPIDAYFDYRFGRLPYRSLEFEHIHLPDSRQFQPVGTINYPNDHEYTRITEFKHLTGQECAGTSIVREYPKGTGEPYYPIPRPENEALYKRYQELANAEKSVKFVGRLAQYRYYNMDQVVGAALKASEDIIGDTADTRRVASG